MLAGQFCEFQGIPTSITNPINVIFQGGGGGGGGHDWHMHTLNVCQVRWEHFEQSLEYSVYVSYLRVEVVKIVEFIA